MTTTLDAERACNALYTAGHYLLERDRVEDAAVLFRTMLVADAEDERGWLALGACHERLEQDEMAQELYGAGAQLARAKTRCLIASARIFEKLDDERAEQALGAAAEAAITDEEQQLVEHARKGRDR